MASRGREINGGFRPKCACWSGNRPPSPLAAATHALDLALWPTSPALMHAHTLLWFAALLAALAALFRRLLPP
ncbi:MAG TPA: hypothetical protein PK847_15655, partial [Candidatus Sumerlaeota bacterium]|nr:hypothetical protein [Candidatus Sumerlaeota bacterium]